MRILAGSVLIVLAASPAVAQDLWTGTYVGLQGGGQWGSVSVTDSGQGVPPGPFEYDISGGLAGVTAGQNWRAGNSNVVLGVEAGLGYMSVDGAGRLESSTPGHHQDLTLDSGVLADLSSRFGVALDNTLIYAKGGVAYFGGVAEQTTTKAEYSSDPTGSFGGLSIGAGVEHYVTDALSLKAEYQHYAFGGQQGHQTALVNDGPTLAGTQFPNRHEFGVDTVKVGVNFHFD